MPIAESPLLAPPSQDLLAGYESALERGWSSNTTKDVSGAELTTLRKDRDDFLADLAGLNRQGGTRSLDDGRIVPMLPFRLFWICDGEFCGSINLQFVHGSEALPRLWPRGLRSCPLEAPERLRYTRAGLPFTDRVGRKLAAHPCDYTGTAGASALAPPIMGLFGDCFGVPITMASIAFDVLATIPVAVALNPMLPWSRGRVLHSPSRAQSN
jgi:hypothetical protein